MRTTKVVGEADRETFRLIANVDKGEAQFAYGRLFNVMEQIKEKDKGVFGTVTEALPNTFFKVKIDGTDEAILTYLAGRMRMNRIRVLIGDRVKVELDPYGGKGRIVKRL